MSTGVHDICPPIHLAEIAQIGLTVKDLTLAKSFYQDILGMQFLFDAGNMAFYQCGAIRLMIGLSDKPFTAASTILYFRVPDLHSAHAALKSRGVAFRQDPHLVARMKSHDLWLAFLNDPDGNPLALMSEVPRDQAASPSQ